MPCPSTRSRGRLRKKDGPSRIGSQVIAFLVYGTYVRPVTRLPSTNGRRRTTSATHDLFQSD